MRYFNRVKVYLASFISLSLLFSSPVSSISAEEVMESSPKFYHDAVLRPGVRAGDGRTLGYIDYLLPLPLIDSPDGLIFVNTKQVFGGDGDSETNAGVGYRQIFDGEIFGEEGFILGGNFFYDRRHTLHNNDFDQLGFGVELFTLYYDFRTNFYFPLDDEESIGLSEETFLFGPTSVLKTTTESFEEPLEGFDYEAGVVVPWISDHIETKVFAGGYHYDSDIGGEDIDGFRGRIEIRPTPFATLLLEMKDDDTIDTDYFIGGYLNLPFDIGKLFQRGNPFDGWKERVRLGQGVRPLRDRLTEPVVRDIDIVSQTVNKTSTPATEPTATNVIYVDNTNTGTENGSLANPYNTIEEALADARFLANPGAIIFVFDGDGTASNSAGDVTLPDDRILWGQGFERYPPRKPSSAPSRAAASCETCAVIEARSPMSGRTVSIP